MCLALVVPAWAVAAPADAPGGADLEDEVERLQGEVERLEATVEELQAGRAEVAEEMRALRAEMQRLARPAAASEPAGQSAAGSANAAKSAAAPAKTAASTKQQAAASAQDAAKPEKQRTVLASSQPEEVGKSKREGRRDGAERDLLERRGGVLVRAGALVTEPRFQYAHVSRNRIQISGFAVVPALVIGRIDSAEIERDIFATSLGLRYGLHDRLQLSADIPYIWRSDDEVVGADGAEEYSKRQDGGIADMRAELLWHAVREKGRIPDVILNFGVKPPTGRSPYDIDRDPAGIPLEFPTGTGHWGFSAGANIVKTFDPVVLLGSAKYYHNLKRDVGSKNGLFFGEIDPGDSIEYSIGAAVGLNESFALSFNFQQRYTMKVKQNGSSIPGSQANAGSFFVGGSYRLAPGFTLQTSLGMGLTDDAPDMVLEFRMPLRLPWRFPSFADFGRDRSKKLVEL